MVVLAGSGAGLVDVASGAVRAMAGRDVRAVSGQWAVLDGREVARRDGEGPAAGAAASPEGVALTCVAGLAGPGPAALVGSAGAHVYLYRAGGDLEPVASFEAAEGRPEWYTPWGGPPDVRSASSSLGGTLLVNVHVGGILRSTDEGASWQPTIDIHTDVHQVLALGGGRAVAACAAGLATSEDDGVTWAIHDEGLHATYARAVAVAGATVLMSVSAGPGGQDAAVYRRPLAGGRFERCGGGLPGDLGGNVDTAWMAGGDDGTAAVATKSGEVFVSYDEGTTWERTGPAVPDLRCLVVG
ncbi:MAG: WD40/YVTN/BNR-like repeat-containing protein [Acidimicrobiales bacterium]